ncbi:DUF3347 domain-containing protein [Algoriphagus hitonicola]|uniref:DUF3347 domain-containing protein n=1 Tax=Algoriphagus hitonicola TaxID=435880 RepID=A0A1I2TTJ7_9BACT|nr:DUF3347 domain-containing protein [Algoriphagus hitonicola]SFG68265.1 Protein of unknown function [Algoriphagus hitonicola]
MKKSILYASIISFVFFSCGENSTTDQAKEETQTSDIPDSSNSISIAKTQATSSLIDSYLVVKDALVADNAPIVRSSTDELLHALENFDFDAVEDNSGELAKLQQEAIALSEKLKSEDIAIQRENFQDLSLVLVDFIKIAGADRTLYHQYCPMYKGNQGGMWLSANDEIKNPLFGSTMLNCGSVEETLSIN